MEKTDNIVETEYMHSEDTASLNTAPREQGDRASMRSEAELTFRAPTSGLSADFLKILALVTMTIDHFGGILIENGVLREANPVVFGDLTAYGLDTIIRQIGRLAFPIYCFLLVEGFLHTRSKPRYALRLFIFALISEIPFDLGFYRQIVYTGHQNVFFTLCIGLLAIWGMDFFYRGKFAFLLRWLGACGCLIGGILASFLLSTDYSYAGVILMIALYLTIGLPVWARFSISYLCFLFGMYLYGGMWQVQNEAICLISFCLMMGYNGVRRLKKGKYFFYIYYPAHITIFTLLSYALFK